MSTLALIVNLVAVFVTVTAETTSPEETTTSNYREQRQSDYDPNIFGVASVAGITSRNGRISTTGGVHFYPAPDGASTTRGDSFYNPATFSKAINGKYASGSVQIQPGALGVSSSAQAGFIDPAVWPIDRWQNKQWQSNQWPHQYNQQNPWPVRNYQWPMQEQWGVKSQFHAPFEQRNGPWFKTVNLDPQVRDVRWLYPSFDPFLNLWR